MLGSRGKVNAIIKPETRVIPGFRDIIGQFAQSFDCELTGTREVYISYEQILELYAEEIAEERIPDYEQLRQQFEFGASEIIEMWTAVPIEELREKMVGSLGGVGIRGALLEHRTHTFWQSLGYQTPPTEQDPAWWRFNAIHMPRSVHEQERLSSWIQAHNF